MRASGATWLLLSLCAACGFDGSTDLLSGTDGGDPDPSADARDPDPTGDGGSDPADAGLVDAATCAFATAEFCGDPDGPLDLGSSFNTDSDPLCRDFTPAGGVDTCLVVVEAVSQTEITTTVSGSRPLILVATGKIVLAGVFDVSSKMGGQLGAGANHAGCAAAADPQNDTGGAGGAAGGSFAAKGGDGGTGDTDSSLGGNGSASAGLAGDAVGAPDFVRGGCPGSVGGHESNSVSDGKGGRPGDSGGAVSFLAGEEFSLLANGRIRAMGAGGTGGQVQSGGGGGGSGGYVRIEAPTIGMQGNVSANSGSGGEGGTRVNGNSVTGNDGRDGLMSTSAAAGGSGAPGSSGDGGNGSSQSVTTGGVGASTIVGAGGGGGSAGFILLKGSVSGSGQSSPNALLLP